MYTATMNDFETNHLTGEARRIADAITAFVAQRTGRPPTGGGCRAFRSPEEWKERGEQYGRNATLVLVHDGGDLAYTCNLDYADHLTWDAFSTMLERLGYYVEGCTGWYSAVYPLG